MPTLADRGVSRGQYGRSPTVVNLSFSRPAALLFFQVAPHLCSGGWLDPVPDPLLFRESGGAGNRAREIHFSAACVGC
jgi:hypothetical protein